MNKELHNKLYDLILEEFKWQKLPTVNTNDSYLSNYTNGLLGTIEPLIDKESAKAKDIIKRLMTWINSKALKCVVSVAYAHGFLITEEECKDGHKACRDAELFLKDTPNE